MKKLAIGLTTFALALSVLALPVNVSAGGKCGGDHQPRRCCRQEQRCCGGNVQNDNDTVVVAIENNAHVDTTSTAVAVSGENWQSHNDDGNVLHTGPASASTWTETTVNTTVVSVNQN